MCKLGAHLLKCCTPCQSSNPPLHPCPLAPPFPLPPPELPQRCPATLPGSHFSLLSAGMLPLSSSCLGLCPGLRWGSLPGWQWGLHRGLCRDSPHFSLLLPPHSDCRHHEPLSQLSPWHMHVMRLTHHSHIHLTTLASCATNSTDANAFGPQCWWRLLQLFRNSLRIPLDLPISYVFLLS